MSASSCGWRGAVCLLLVLGVSGCQEAATQPAKKSPRARPTIQLNDEMVARAEHQAPSKAPDSPPAKSAFPYATQTPVFPTDERFEKTPFATKRPAPIRLSKPAPDFKGAPPKMMMKMQGAPSARTRSPSKGSAADAEAAIRKAVDGYVTAFNRADAVGLAAFWAPEGEYHTASGEVLKGHVELRRSFEDYFAANQGARLEVPAPTIRLLSPDVAMEEGRSKLLLPGAPPAESSYLAVHVRRGNEWRLDNVRISAPSAGTAQDHLGQLAWLVGVWEDSSEDATVQATVTWSKGRSFLVNSFKVSVKGDDDLEGTQVIGWDAAAGHIRSWVFDSDGGFVEGVWSKRGAQWFVKANAVLPDGRRASATNIYTPIDANSFVLKSIGRKLDGQFQPNIEGIKVVKKSAQAQTATQEKQP